MKAISHSRPVLAAVLARGLIFLAVAGYTAAFGHARAPVAPTLSYMSVSF